MELIKGLNQNDIDEIKSLYKEAFDDSDAFIDLYFDNYMKNNEYYYIKHEGKIVFSCCNNIKRICIDNQKYNAAFIVAVSTKKEFQGKGIMKSVFQKWLDDLSFFYKHIFIQAYNWDVYKSYDFKVCTNKNVYTLRHDQYLKPLEYDNDVDYDKIIEIHNQFIKQNRIDNFSYKTKKENQLYYKMLKSENSDKIIVTRDAYIVFDSNNVIYDFAFLDLKNFIKLLSNFKDSPLKIKSYLDLDKRYFTLLEENKVDTKVYKIDDLDIYFNEMF